MNRHPTAIGPARAVVKEGRGFTVGHAVYHLTCGHIVRRARIGRIRCYCEYCGIRSRPRDAPGRVTS
jgi:hypothetical protein